MTGTRKHARTLLAAVAAGALAVGISCNKSPAEDAKADATAVNTVDISTHIPHDQLKEQLDRYARVDISYDESVLSKPEKDALAKLVQVGSIMDEIFLRQA